MSETIWMDGDPQANYHDLKCACSDHCGQCWEDLIKLRAKGLVGPRERYCSTWCRNHAKRERALDRLLSQGRI